MLVTDGDRVTPERFAEATGWVSKPEGLCQDDICVPAPGARRADGSLDVDVAASRLGMPIVVDPDRGLRAVGPATLTGHTLPTAAAPDPELLTRDGEPFRLSSLHGRKVLLVAWASY